MFHSTFTWSNLGTACLVLQSWIKYSRAKVRYETYLIPGRKGGRGEGGSVPGIGYASYLAKVHQLSGASKI